MRRSHGSHVPCCTYSLVEFSVAKGRNCVPGADSSYCLCTLAEHDTSRPLLLHAIMPLCKANK
jgi:hypothetical protein